MYSTNGRKTPTDKEFASQEAVDVTCKECGYESKIRKVFGEDRCCPECGSVLYPPNHSIK